MSRPLDLAIRALAVGAFLALQSGDAIAARTYGSLAFEPCTLSASGLAVTVSAQCTTLVVPENRARPDGRKLRLAIAWVPGDARRTEPDPVFMLAGGPGQSALQAFPGAAGAFREVLRHRDVVLVDQRGTGGSHPLVCRDANGKNTVAEGDERDVIAARRFAAGCLEQLDADPRFFTTSDAVADLEAVRRALGAPQVNLVGISYGTRVAQEYLRRHPDRIRTVVLDGVVPAPLALGADHARNLEDAVNRQFARCVADAACTRRFGSPRARLDALLAQLRARPEPVHFRDPLTGELRDDVLTADTVAGVVRLYSYMPQLSAMLPLSLAEAGSGQPEVLMAQARMIDDLVGEQISHGLELAVACSEDVDRLARVPRDEGTLMGNAFVDSLRAQCSVWPRGHVPADFHDPLRSTKPVLLLSGEFDPVTPPRYGEEVVRLLPNGRHLVLRGQGHNVMGVGCAPRLMAQFIERADATRLDAHCLDRLIAAPPFAGTYGWEP